MLAHQGHLRALWRAAAQPRHRLQHRRDRAAVADLSARGSGSKGKMASHLALNPHPTADPGDRVRLGRADPFASAPRSAWRTTSGPAPTSISPAPDGSLRSNRAFCQTAGLYACDMFIGSTLQIDLQGNSSTVTDVAHRRLRRRAEHGRRCRAAGAIPASRGCRRAARPIPTAPPLLRRGRKLVVQIGETFGDKNVPLFVEKLDALTLAEKLKLDLAPVMIYGDDVTPHRDRGGHRQPAALPRRGRARAGDPRRRRLHRRRPRPRRGDGAAPARARRDPPAGRSRHRSARRRPQPAGARVRSRISSQWSGGLYAPPSQFRNW